jgi:lipid-A-disaccharide synthase
LADKELVPEILQDQVEPEVLGPAVLKALEDETYQNMLADEFAKIHATLHQDADEKAAEAVVSLLQDKGVI